MTNKYKPLREIVKELPVEKGEMLWVTADLTRLAMAVKRKERNFSADTLIDLLQEKVGENGTLVIPAFNYNLKSNSSFDIGKTRPVTGALALVAFGRKDFTRTRHPLHSFMVWGKHSDQLSKLSNTGSFDNDSPFNYLYENNASALLIGTSVKEAFTFAHFVEATEKVSYRRDKKYRIRYTDRQGNASVRSFKLYAKKPGWTMCLWKLQELMEQRGMIWKETHNGVSFSKISLVEAYDLIIEDIRENKAHNIACFNPEIWLKGIVKSVLRKVFGYQTVSERIWQ